MVVRSFSKLDLGLRQCQEVRTLAYGNISVIRTVPSTVYVFALRKVISNFPPKKVFWMLIIPFYVWYAGLLPTFVGCGRIKRADANDASRGRLLVAELTVLTFSDFSFAARAPMAQIDVACFVGLLAVFALHVVSISARMPAEAQNSSVVMAPVYLIFFELRSESIPCLTLDKRALCLVT